VSVIKRNSVNRPLRSSGTENRDKSPTLGSTPEPPKIPSLQIGVASENGKNRTPRISGVRLEP
jgi:hypothetical protein